MFSNSARLHKRTPNNGIDRESYIRLLADEYYDTTNLEAQIQVTANLANFAYDPINYAPLRHSQVPQLFVELLRSPEPQLVLYGIAGLCNCCLDSGIRDDLLTAPESSSAASASTTLGPIGHIVSLLRPPHKRPVQLNALTTLLHLHAVDAQRCCPLICTPAIVARIRQLQHEHPAGELHSLCTVFLADYGCCGAGAGGASSHRQLAANSS